MKRIIVFTIWLMLLASLSMPVHAQQNALYEKHWLVVQNDTMPYRLLLPDGFQRDSAYPLVLFLHGSAGQGIDNEKQLVHGSSLFLKPEIRKQFHAFVLFPQCSGQNAWVHYKVTEDSAGKRIFDFPPDAAPTPAMDMVIRLVRQMMTDYRISPPQVYVIGLGIGGMGTFDIVRRMPNTFAAGISIGGGANPAIAKDIRKTSFWIIHGSKDVMVPPALSEAMAQAIQSFYDAGEMQYTVYPQAGQNSWDPAFADPALLPWLFSQRKN